MTPEEERRCVMLAAGITERIRDLVEVLDQASVFRCRDCHGATARDICPACERRRERKLLADQIKEARA